MDIWIVSTILVITIYLLITEKISIDLTAVGIMVLLVVSQVLTPREAVAGFANPAVITVGAMFIVSRGMIRTGGLEFLSRKIIKVARANLLMALTLILFSVAIASAFINNTPVVILFIPVVMAMCNELNLSPSKFLIPVSYASILAGTCTLIGTSTNIIISDLSQEFGFGPISMFELSYIGAPIAITGVLFLLFAAPKLLPEIANPVTTSDNDSERKYLAELRIVQGARCIGLTPPKAFGHLEDSLEIIEHIRKDTIHHPCKDCLTIENNDILLVKATHNQLVELLHQDGIELPKSEEGLNLGVQKDAPIVVELLIAPGSSMRGQKLNETEIAMDDDINIIAIMRSNLHISEKQLDDVRLQTGDTLLVWCPESALKNLRNDPNCIIMEDVYEDLVHKRKAIWSIVNFVCMIATASLGIADIMTCSLTAAFLMIITGCLQMRDAYRSIQGDVLLLIAGTISLGLAMQKTGTSQLYA